MDVLTVLAILILIVLLAGFALVLRGKPEVSSDEGSIMLLQQQLQNLERSVDEKLGKGTEQMFQGMKVQAEQSQRLMSDITEQMSKQLIEVVKGVTETKESTKQVFTIAEQLQNLEKILTHQKQRGNWGEASLELTLGGFLPPNGYKMQHEFSDGKIVDAVIYTKEGMIPVDAKFSLDNYNRLAGAIDESQQEELEKAFKNDLKLRIDETSQYIREKEGTLPIAFMYIPAEAIYYDLLVGQINPGKVNSRNLIDYAYREKRVIIASPTTFMAYLSMVANGMRAFKVEENFKEIQKNIDALGKHLKSYEDYYKKIGNSLSTTVNHYNAGSKELGKIDKDVLRITGAPVGMEPELLEKPVAAAE